jgi:hypothetical protein
VDKPFKLKYWQEKVIKLLKRQSQREILWIYDEVGNTGKSFLALYMVTLMEGIIFENGSDKDLSYAYNSEPLVIFNFARHVRDDTNYGFMEKLKDGILFSSKYESRVKYFEPPKVICFANYEPDYEKLSADRWRCLKIRQSNLTDKLTLRYMFLNGEKTEKN